MAPTSDGLQHDLRYLGSSRRTDIYLQSPSLPHPSPAAPYFCRILDTVLQPGPTIYPIIHLTFFYFHSTPDQAGFFFFLILPSLTL